MLEVDTPMTHSMCFHIRMYLEVEVQAYTIARTLLQSHAHIVDPKNDPNNLLLGV